MWYVLLKSVQRLHYVFTEYTVLFSYNNCGTQSCAGREALLFVILIDS